MFCRKRKCVEGFGGGEHEDVDERVILKWILRKELELEDVDWMNLAQDSTSAGHLWTRH
jgi:hypothetical protein